MTSQEELQSINEELTTVNNELQAKMAELTQLNNDMDNLLSGTGIGTIFVDLHQRILRFTPTITKIINLIPGDIGRPVSHIVTNLNGDIQLTANVQSVLDTLIPKEVEVQVKEGTWFSMRIIPYRTMENVIEGAVITFVDINDLKNTEEKIKILLSERELILKEVHHRIINNLNTINSILSLQAQKIGKEPVTVEIIRDLECRIQGMAVLYNKLYQSPNFSDVQMKGYFPVLIEQIISNFPNKEIVKVVTDIDDFILDAKKVQPLGIIMNELLTNCMKYAFEGRKDGLIKVSAKIKAGRVIIVVEDNGIGIGESLDLEKSSGFGMRLINLLTQQLQSSILIEQENGTRFILEFDYIRKAEKGYI